MECICKVKNENIWFVVCLFFIGFNITAQVGIGTENPTTMLDINGALSLRQAEDAIELENPVNGVYNDVELGFPLHSFYRINGAEADFSITGLQGVSGTMGQMLFLQNTTDFDMTILHKDSLSDPRNQFIVSKYINVPVPGKYGTIILQYSTHDGGVWWLPGGMDNAETIHYSASESVLANQSKTFYVPAAQVLPSSAAFSVNVAGGESAGNAINDITIEYMEVQIDTIVFRVRNSSDDPYDALKFNIMIHR